MKRILKNIYDKMPFKKQMFDLLKTFMSPSEKVYRHLHFHGDFPIQIDDEHSFRMKHFGFELENSLYWEGIRNGWEKNSVSIWVELVRQSDVIIDVGANTGIYSLIAKSLNRQAQVYAFEPIHRVYEKLVSNNSINDYDIICLDYALSNSNGMAIVYDTPTEHIYSVTINQNLNAPETEVIETKISVKRLDTFIEESKIRKIGLIKIDVETHEPEVLEGFGKYLAEFKPAMLIEILSDEVGEKVESYVKDNGYLYFNIDEKTDSIRQVEHITKSDYYNYLICSESSARKLNLLK